MPTRVVFARSKGRSSVDRSNQPARRARPAVELLPLESRRLLAVSTDPAGWTVITPSADSRVIYVSSSGGNDLNNGLSEAAPVATIARGVSLLRSGFPDHLLLKRGDTWTANFGNWNRSGRNAQEPMLLGAYGTGPRPQLNTGTSFGINTVTTTGGVNHLAIVSLSLFPHTFNHTAAPADLAGLRLTATGRNILVEDVRVAGYKDNIVVSGESASFATSDVTIRRSQVLDAHADRTASNNVRSQGIYVGASGARVTIEENVIDHNGWRPGVPADRWDQNHNVYARQGARDVVVRDNLITRAAFYGLKFNAGGTATGNFFARNSESIYMERHTLAAGNVITEAVDTAGGQFVVPNWGVGINTQSSPSAVIRRNLVFKALSATASGVAGIQLFNNGSTFNGVVEHNVVYNWRNALLVNTPGNGLGSVIIRNNQLHTLADTGAGDQRSAAVQSALLYQNNTYSAGTRTSTANRISSFQSLSQWNTRTAETGAVYALPTGFPDPNRDIAGYAWTQGLGATFEDFIAAARAMDKTTWNPAFTAGRVNPWLWQGFDTAGPPAGLVADFNTESLPLTIDVQFSEDVGSSLEPADLAIVNLGTGETVPLAGLRYSSASAIARLTLAAGPLPDGNYRLTLPAGAVIDPSGTPSGTPFVFDFFAFAGDANRDRRIDIGDFSVLAANFNTAGPPSRGDANYSGTIDIGDFSILASRFNAQLPAARPEAAPTSIGAGSMFSSRPLALAGTIDELD